MPQVETIDLSTCECCGPCTEENCDPNSTNLYCFGTWNGTSWDMTEAIPCPSVNRCECYNGLGIGDFVGEVRQSYCACYGLDN